MDLRPGLCEVGPLEACQRGIEIGSHRQRGTTRFAAPQRSRGSELGGEDGRHRACRFGRFGQQRGGTSRITLFERCGCVGGQDQSTDLTRGGAGPWRPLGQTDREGDELRAQGDRRVGGGPQRIEPPGCRIQHEAVQLTERIRAVEQAQRACDVALQRLLVVLERGRHGGGAPTGQQLGACGVAGRVRRNGEVAGR